MCLRGQAVASVYALLNPVGIIPALFTASFDALSCARWHLLIETPAGLPSAVQKQNEEAGCFQPASRQLPLEWANVLRLPPLRSFGDFKFHGLTLLQTLKTTRLDRRKMHEHVLARLAADKAVAFGVVKPLYCSLFHDVAGIPFNRFVLEIDSEVLAAGY